MTMLAHLERRAVHVEPCTWPSQTSLVSLLGFVSFSTYFPIRNKLQLVTLWKGPRALSIGCVWMASWVDSPQVWRLGRRCAFAGGSVWTSLGHLVGLTPVRNKSETQPSGTTICVDRGQLFGCSCALLFGPSVLSIPRDSMRQKFLPQIKKGAFLDLRHVFLICGVFLELRQNLFSVFATPRFAAEIGGNAAEIGGNAAEIPGKANGVAAFLFWLRRLFLFAADFLECGGNFRRNALRQKFPPQEVLGIHVNGLPGCFQISERTPRGYSF